MEHDKHLECLYYNLKNNADVSKKSLNHKRNRFTNTFDGGIRLLLEDTLHIYIVPLQFKMV